MLQQMRNGAQSGWAKAVIGLIIISFAIFGLESLVFSGSGSSIADVNGDEISELALQQAIMQQRQRLLEVFGENIDVDLLSDEQLQTGVLEGLIQRLLLKQQASAYALHPSPRGVGRNITSNEVFQSGGVFSEQIYRQVLRDNGLSNEQFRVDQEEIDTSKKLQIGLISSEFITDLELAATINIINEQRDIRYLLVPASDLRLKTPASKDKIAEYYYENLDQFMLPERVKVDYVYLHLDNFRSPVNSDELELEVESALQQFSSTAEAEIAHVLLTREAGETDLIFQERTARVQKALASGRDFSEIAKMYSDDVGSGSSGGYLGFTDGTVFPSEMERAIRNLDIGEISGPVSTDAGTHFILLKQRLAPSQPDDEALREEIREGLQVAKARESLLVMADRLRDLSFNSLDLESVAVELGLEKKTSDFFSLSNGTGLFSNERLRQAAFAEDVRVAGNNSDLVELTNDEFVVVRIREKLPSGAAALEDVFLEISTKLDAIEQAKMLSIISAKVNKKLAGGTSLESIAADLNLEWRVELAATRDNMLLPREILSHGFNHQLSKKETVSEVALTNGDYALVQVTKVAPGIAEELSLNERESVRVKSAQLRERVVMDEWLTSLRASGKIVIR